MKAAATAGIVTPDDTVATPDDLAKPVFDDRGCNVRLWHKTQIVVASLNVRFLGQSRYLS
jgi:hypothetical protein